ncbi:hypothetical protein GRI97_07990 [Altererythrobacter xixiisoli]|uniref:Uncharacterized protein n=1 Tax=Croceibacterium xixiisoli TaxID=1476466 RepID=A0A6I4TSL1_9SPHN|nr:hypothetical protein [Croceibacterium xixiisoli]MXO98926.1 hypothetical protein [Croceibacterium xixiisoli]
MPASPARIGFVLSEYRRATVESPPVSARYGNLARSDENPVESFFVNVADAQIMARQRHDLLSADRRRFGVTVTGLDEVLALPLSGPVVPSAHYEDRQRGTSQPSLVADVSMDFATQTAKMVVWG